MKLRNRTLNFERTHRRMDKPKAICPFNFSKVEGIKSVKTEGYSAFYAPLCILEAGKGVFWLGFCTLY